MPRHAHSNRCTYRLHITFWTWSSYLHMCNRQQAFMCKGNALFPRNQNVEYFHHHIAHSYFIRGLFREHSPSWKLMVDQMEKKLWKSYGTRMFFTVFTRDYQRSQLWGRWIQCASSITVFSICIWYYISTCVLSWNSLLPSGFPTEIFHAFFIFCMRVTLAAHRNVIFMLIWSP